MAEDFDIAKVADGRRRGVVKEFAGIEVDKELRIGFAARDVAATICGVEVVAE